MHFPKSLGMGTAWRSWTRDSVTWRAFLGVGTGPPPSRQEPGVQKRQG